MRSRLDEIEARAEASPVEMLRGDVYELVGMCRDAMASNARLIKATGLDRRFGVNLAEIRAAVAEAELIQGKGSVA